MTQFLPASIRGPLHIHRSRILAPKPVDKQTKLEIENTKMIIIKTNLNKNLGLVSKTGGPKNQREDGKQHHKGEQKARHVEPHLRNGSSN